MEHHKLTALRPSSNKLEHLSRSVGANHEQPVVDFDHPDGIVHGVADRLLADAVTACRRGDPHSCCVPHYQKGRHPVVGPGVYGYGSTCEHALRRGVDGGLFGADG